MFNSRNMLMAVVILTLFAAPIIAAGGKAVYTISKPMVIAGTEIRPGDYEVKWESKSPEAEVTFKLKGKVIATVQGKIETPENKTIYNSMFVGKDSAGRDAIKGFLFSDKNVRIVFE